MTCGIGHCRKLIWNLPSGTTCPNHHPLAHPLSRRSSCGTSDLLPFEAAFRVTGAGVSAACADHL